MSQYNLSRCAFHCTHDTRRDRQTLCCTRLLTLLDATVPSPWSCLHIRFSIWQVSALSPAHSAAT